MTMPLKRNENGLIPTIAQHHETGQVLMLAYMSAESLAHTLQDGDAWFYSPQPAGSSGTRVKSPATSCG